jgi:hypothetical protein
MFRVSGKAELKAPDKGLHSLLGALQKKTAFLPDYSFKKAEEKQGFAKSHEGNEAAKSEEGKEEGWPNISAWISFSGLVGGAGILHITSKVVDTFFLSPNTISIFFKPLIQRHQPDGTFCILPLERFCPVCTTIQQQQLIAVQFLRCLDQRPDFPLQSLWVGNIRADLNQPRNTKTFFNYKIHFLILWTLPVE